MSKGTIEKSGKKCYCGRPATVEVSTRHGHSESCDDPKHIDKLVRQIIRAYGGSEQVKIEWAVGFPKSSTPTKAG